MDKTGKDKIYKDKLDNDNNRSACMKQIKTDHDRINKGKIDKKKTFQDKINKDKVKYS